MKTVLVTGGAGFVGSNFISWVLDTCPDWRVVNLDALGHTANPENLGLCCHDARYTFIQGDIQNRDQVRAVFQKYTIDAVVHCAAESLGDCGTDMPVDLIGINVLGTQILLDAACEAWKIHSEKRNSKDYRAGVYFVYISTADVYGFRTDAGLFNEEAPLAPKNPQAASKAAGELMVQAYFHTYRLPTAIIRCSSLYGPYQYPDQLIPGLIRNALAGQTQPQSGDLVQSRDWLHVTDCCTAIAAVLKRGSAGEIFNVGGDMEATDIMVMETVLDTLGKPRSLLRQVYERSGPLYRCALDHSKITRELGWQPRYKLTNGLRETVQWYADNQDWMERLVSGQYRAYNARMFRGIE